MSRLTSIAAVLAGCGLLMAQPAGATVLLSVGANPPIADNSANDTDPLPGEIVNKVLPLPSGFTTSSDTGIGEPSLIDLSSVDVSFKSGSAVVVKFTETGLTSSVPKGWLTQFSGSWFGGTASVELKTYLDTSDTAFGTGTLLSDLKTTSPLFALSGASGPAGGGLFSITEVLTIKVIKVTNGRTGEVFSLDGMVIDAPEPSSIGLLSVGLVPLALRRRWVRSA